MSTGSEHGVSVLSTSECLALLRQARVSRLAVRTADGVDIFPVNHVVDHGTVVLRTAGGTKLAAALDGPVALEADGYDAARDEAWSVVLKGRAELVQQVDELLKALHLPLVPWHPTPKPLFLRIVPESTTGRRFAVVDPAAWARPWAGGAAAPWE